MIRKAIKYLKKLDDAYVIARETGLNIRRSLLVAFNKKMRDAFIEFKCVPFHKNGVIFDIGASRGKFLESTLLRFQPKQIVCFEPIPELYQFLQKKFNKLNQVILFNQALGSSPGNSKLQINKHDEASSLLNIQNEGTTRFVNRDLSPVKVIEVKVTTVDFIVNLLKIKVIDLLKIDVQGYELEVLKGAKENLNSIKIIKLEISFYQLYYNSPSFDEIHKFLEQNHFYLHHLGEFQKGNRGIILQADAIYLNKKFFNHDN